VSNHKEEKRKFPERFVGMISPLLCSYNVNEIVANLFVEI